MKYTKSKTKKAIRLLKKVKKMLNEQWIELRDEKDPDTDLMEVYKEDFDDYQEIIYRLENDNVKGAGKKYWYLDTASREYIYESGLKDEEVEWLEDYLPDSI